MGSGKSAIGKMVADRLGMRFIDTDEEIEKKQGKSISRIFEESGEEAFRQMETAELWSLMFDDKEAVISLGGGTPVRDANREIIKKLGKVIYLKAPEELLVKRLSEKSVGRPMLSGDDVASRVRKLLSDREEGYESLADIVVELFDERLEASCSRVEDAMGGRL